MTHSISTALIHSVVALHISDQWTRAHVQNDGPQVVCGALLGKHSGRNIEILNSFEANASIVDGKLEVDEEYFIQRSLLYKETFVELDFLGFYVTCTDHEKTDPADIHLQRQAMQHNEAPFLLKFNASEPVICDKLSITIFDSTVDPADEQRLIFQQIPMKIVNELAEQIGLDHVARYSKNNATAESSTSKHLGAQFGAINAFAQELAIAHDYVKDVSEGKIERDESILREIQKLCLRLSAFDGNALSDKDILQSSDHKLLVLLSALTGVQGQMFNLMEKLNVLARERLHQERSSFVSHRSQHYFHHGGPFPFGRLFF